MLLVQPGGAGGAGSGAAVGPAGPGPGPGAGAAALPGGPGAWGRGCGRGQAGHRGRGGRPHGLLAGGTVSSLRGGGREVVVGGGKLQALVYDILPLTTAVFSYAIWPRKLSANEQFFVGAQTAVSLLQTTPIKQGVSFITANKVYTSTNKTTIV